MYYSVLSSWWLSKDCQLAIYNDYNEYTSLVDPLSFGWWRDVGFVELVNLDSCAVLGMPDCCSHPALLSICWASQLGNAACQDRWCKHFQICSRASHSKLKGQVMGKETQVKHEPQNIWLF